MIVKARAIARSGNLEHAIQKTDKKIVPSRRFERFGLKGTSGNTDEWFARHVGAWIETERVWRERDGKRVRVQESRIVFPPKLKIEIRHLPWLIDIMIRDYSSDVVIQARIGKRPIYLHSYIDRLVQNCILGVLGTRLEHLLTDAAHAYRPGRSLYTALWSVRQAVREGYHWIVKADISDFFGSCSAELVDHLLSEWCPWMAHDLRQMIYRCHRPVISSRETGTYQAGSNGHPATLLQGSIIAPALSNLVGHCLIDDPVAQAMGERVVLVRYGDDFLIAARKPADAIDALERVIEPLLNGFNIHLSERKTMRQPVNVMRKIVPFLGKVIVGEKIRTPASGINRMVSLLATTHRKNLRSVFFSVMDSLVFDKPATRKEVMKRLQKRDPRRGRTAQNLLQDYYRLRAKHPPQDPDPQEEIAPYYAVAA